MKNPKAAKTTAAANNRDGKSFNFQEYEATGSPILCNNKAKMESGKVDLHGMMVRMPVALRDRLQEKTAGSMSVTICALVEYALDHLENEEKAIVVTNR